MPDKIGKLEGMIRPAEIVRPPRRQAEEAAPAGKSQKPSNISSVKVQKELQHAEKSSETKQKDSDRLIRNINNIFGAFEIEARYFVDVGTEIQVIQLRDINTQKLIRQVPTEEFLNRISRTRDLIGLLFNNKA